MPGSLDVRSGPNSGHSASGGASEAVGSILFERFLVIDDVSDPIYQAYVKAYLVKDLKDLCRTVVLRIFKWENKKRVDTGPSLQDVCSILAREKHANIEQVLETGRLFDGSPFSVTASKEGTTFDRMIGPDRRLEVDRIAMIVRSLTEALMFVHSNNLLHCDIRPGNIRLSEIAGEGPVVQLINFGCAWPIDSRGEGLSCVSGDEEAISFAAPELHTKLGHRAAASDIFSVAAVAYRLAVGRSPFRGSDKGDLLTVMSRGLRGFPSDERTDLSRETDNLLASALQYEPAWRPQEIEEWGKRLADSLDSRSPYPVEIFTPAYQSKKPTVETRLDEPPVQYDDTVQVLTTLQRISSKPGSHLSDRAVAFSLIILLLAGALSIPIGQTFFTEDNDISSPSSITTREPENRSPKVVRFWFESRPAPAASFAAGGSELVIEADKPGILSVIVELAGNEGGIAYKRIFPADGSTSPAAALEVEKPARIRSFLRPELGTAGAVWIVWTSAAKSEPDQMGVENGEDALVTGESARRLRHFLERNRNARLEVEQDESAGMTKLTGLGDRVVYRITLSEP